MHTLSPGAWRKNASGDCEWYSPPCPTAEHADSWTSVTRQSNERRGLTRTEGEGADVVHPTRSESVLGTVIYLSVLSH